MERPAFSQAETLILQNLRDIKEGQDKSNDMITDLSIRMTRVELGHTSNEKGIKALDLKLENHISDHKSRKMILYASMISLLSGLFLGFLTKIKMFLKGV